MITVSTSKSNGSNWLEKLRSSRGIPVGEESLGLDHFLQTQQTSDTSIAAVAANDSTSIKSSASISSRTDPTHSRATLASGAASGAQATRSEYLGNTCANILYDLFNFGEVAETCAKKSSRKQRNPKFCVLSTPSSVGIDDCPCPTASNDLVKDKSAQYGVASSGDNSLSEKPNENVKKDEFLKIKSGKEQNVASTSCHGVNDGEDSDWDLKLYSRSDVTLIDTSTGGWKSEKVVLRKDDVWKVKEKRSRVCNFAGRKRKVDGLFEKNEEAKKMKGLGSSDQLVPEVQPRKEHGVPALSKRKTGSGREEECSKELMNSALEVSAQRFRDSKSTQTVQSAKPVLLVKPVLVVENSGAKRAGKTSLKKTPKRFVAQQRS